MKEFEEYKDLEQAADKEEAKKSMGAALKEGHADLMAELKMKMAEETDNEEDYEKLKAEDEEDTKKAEKQAEEDIASLEEEADDSVDEEEVDKIEHKVTKAKHAKLELDGLTTASKKAKKSLYKSPKIIPIGDELRTDTTGQIRYNDFVKLKESEKAKKPITGIVAQTRYFALGDKEIPCAVVLVGIYKVLIPYTEMGMTLPEEIKGSEKDQIKFIKMLLDMRLGAEIDFIVLGVDETKGVASASRRLAMNYKRKMHYFTPDKSGNYPINEDDLVEARVVAVQATGIWIEVFGIEMFIKQNELSYVRMMDAADEYMAGDVVVIKLTSLMRSKVKAPNGKMVNSINVTASVKQAKPDPRKEAYDFYERDTKCLAIVTGVTEYGVYIRLGGKDGKIDALCKFPDLGVDIGKGSIVQAVITTKSEENYRIFARITRVMVR